MPVLCQEPLFGEVGTNDRSECREERRLGGQAFPSPSHFGENKEKKIKEIVIIIAKINANTLNCSRLRHSQYFQCNSFKLKSNFQTARDIYSLDNNDMKTSKRHVALLSLIFSLKVFRNRFVLYILNRPSWIQPRMRYPNNLSSLHENNNMNHSEFFFTHLFSSFCSVPRYLVLDPLPRKE